MRYFIGCVILLITVAGCSSTEPIQKEEITEPVEPVQQDSPIPSWYNAGVHSSADSLSLHGYALASAMDSLTSAELSKETALEYLRFEIDRTVEDVRKELADSASEEEGYNSPAFIINLRKTVSELPLNSVSVTHEHESTEKGIHYSYAKASLLRTELMNLIENKLNDDVFLEKMNTTSK